MYARAAGVAALLAAAAAGCAHQYLDPRLYGQVREPVPDNTAGTVQVRFLGVGGFLLQRGDDIVMTAPFYTNPGEEFLLGSKQVRPNEGIIRRLLPERWVKDTTAILIGHSHYDHLMDVPFIQTRLAKKAFLYGSLTMKQLAMAPPYPVPKDHVVVVTDHEGRDKVDYRPCKDTPKEACHSGSGDGEWIEVNQGVRIRALCSRHSPAPIIGAPWPGCLTAVPQEPTRVQDWKLGDTYAFVIDFLEKGQPVFRVYYQDTATNPTYGYVPKDLLPRKDVDLALLCAAGFDQVKDNPAGIVKNTNPRYVIYGHWENFFKPQTKPLETLYVFDYSELVRRMKALTPGSGGTWKGEFWFAAPGQLFVFEPKSTS